MNRLPGEELFAAPGFKGRMCTNWKRIGRYLLLMLLGAFAGAAYSRLAGCRTGACPVWGSAWTSALYSTGVGIIIARGPPPSSAHFTQHPRTGVG